MKTYEVADESTEKIWNSKDDDFSDASTGSNSERGQRVRRKLSLQKQKPPVHPASNITVEQVAPVLEAVPVVAAVEETPAEALARKRKEAAAKGAATRQRNREMKNKYSKHVRV